ncbi:GTP-binding protein SAR1b-like [Zootermopsis nevadensis]|uniref:small monomeric GTPase n=1 Tax=Zootermopsis nevadensis TaxID=136037 RepID=A0A067QRI8_ZOONE|nr:GTP-binding protein SAR1b-like [Zootermopsis nevadensis]XP_021933087.1 GTP-binding protein SAR1b-like [Zootermopsis nevadensis]KDR12356.1 GTP-binding protein SAR1b [Zootermopsis nevadensis]
MKGDSKGRCAWQKLFKAVHGVIYVVDCTRDDQWAQDKDFLESLLINPAFKGAPILAILNKLDNPTQGLVNRLNLQFTDVLGKTTGKGTRSQALQKRPFEVFQCSAHRRSGYQNGFEWLASYID